MAKSNGSKPGTGTGENQEQQGAESGAQSQERMIKVRVLRKCEHGNCNDVVEVPASVVQQQLDALDPDEDAVAYAESLQA